MANTLTSYLQYGLDPDKQLSENDLWQRIVHALDAGARQHILIKWIPSHLDDTAKEHIKQKHLLAGNIDTIDIAGNVAADKLANEGREMHDDVTPLLQLSQDKVYVTTLIQKCFCAFGQTTSTPPQPRSRTQTMPTAL